MQKVFINYKNKINKKPYVITIDGPAGVGKTTLCKKISQMLKWNFLNSGLIYRIIAFYITFNQINISSEKKILSLIYKINKNFSYNNIKIIFQKKNIINNIKSSYIGNVASKIASYSKVRDALLIQQRAFRKFPGLVAEGRDMGTVVFKDAIIKIFLNANLKKRATYRMLQLQKLGFDVNFKQIFSEIKKRDIQDYNRKYCPLIPAKNAFILDSTEMNMEEIIQIIFQYISKNI